MCLIPNFASKNMFILKSFLNYLTLFNSNFIYKKYPNIICVHKTQYPKHYYHKVLGSILKRVLTSLITSLSVDMSIAVCLGAPCGP